jgi:hypothetical protein
LSARSSHRFRPSHDLFSTNLWPKALNFDHYNEIFVRPRFVGLAAMTDGPCCRNVRGSNSRTTLVLHP